MTKRIYFDIETGARPEEEISHLMPEVSAPANYKDPIKIAEYITEKKNTWMEGAALSAVTGKVLAIGFRAGGSNLILGTGDEALDLRAFWTKVEAAAREGSVLVGFNIARFDVPFLVRRSWGLGVPVPWGVFNGRFLNHNVFLDLYEEWQCGDRGESISLKRLSEFLGVGTKDKDGALAFAEKWVTDRKAAIAYLENDLVLTEAVAEKLLGPWPPVSALPSFISPATKATRARKVKPGEKGTPKTEAAAAPDRAAAVAEKTVGEVTYSGDF